MIVLFGYVFGSAIKVPGGGNYREYLMPGAVRHDHLHEHRDDDAGGRH
jgi:hypothetical protein